MYENFLSFQDCEKLRMLQNRSGYFHMVAQTAKWLDVVRKSFPANSIPTDDDKALLSCVYPCTGISVCVKLDECGFGSQERSEVCSRAIILGHHLTHNR